MKGRTEPDKSNYIIVSAVRRRKGGAGTFLWERMELNTFGAWRSQIFMKERAMLKIKRFSFCDYHRQFLGGCSPEVCLCLSLFSLLDYFLMNNNNNTASLSNFNPRNHILDRFRDT
jgi:hypothetical protein